MIGHGYYVRKPKDLEKGWVLWVKRWKCKACGHTVGAVPSFLLFHRHYLISDERHHSIQTLTACGIFGLFLRPSGILLSEFYLPPPHHR